METFKEIIIMDILLVEPSYKNKYPPMSLMKISTYHKDRGDNVTFVKGNLNLYKKWDRIYITTLFTFYYKDVLKTINYYKNYVDSIDNIYVGGILASLLKHDLSADSNIKNIIKGRLVSSSLLGFEDNINIDELPLDYDILLDIDYKYPAGDNFFAYTTRGCINKCPFCAVPILEGDLQITNNIFHQIKKARELYGDKRNILLMDNNILGIPTEKLKCIVKDLNNAGFIKEPNFHTPSKFLIYFDAYHRYRTQNLNSYHIENKILSTFYNLMNKKISNLNIEQVNALLSQVGINYENEIDMIINNIDFFINLEKNHSYKKAMFRFVDFNQGMDARQLTEEKMKVLSTLPIKPFRIAYDKLGFTDIYKKAIRLAAKYGITEFSNYMLYNFNDSPLDLYKRLKVNIDLAEELNVHIYSFPMKFEPIENKQRGHIDENWNKHYVRSIKAILNVSKGVFSGDRSFFNKAFGETEELFFEILSMPKELITYRSYYENSGITNKWRKEFYNLTDVEKNTLLDLLSNDITISNSPTINSILRFYRNNILNKKENICLI